MDRNPPGTEHQVHAASLLAVENIGNVGYVFGQSFKGTIKDAVTFYQGATNAQTGSYKEELTYKVSGPYLTVGMGYSF